MFWLYNQERKVNQQDPQHRYCHQTLQEEQKLDCTFNCQNNHELKDNIDQRITTRGELQPQTVATIYLHASIGVWK